MFDTTIVLSKPDTTLGTDSSHYTLLHKGRKMGRIPPTMIEQIIVHHSVEVTRKAMERLGNTGVPVTFLNKEGRVNARLVSPWKFGGLPRIEQSRIYLDPQTRLTAARRWVDAKVANGATVLKRHYSNHPNPELNNTAKRLTQLREKIRTAQDIPSLLGYEGTVGRLYFSAFKHTLRADWAKFEERNRRPPKDPINAILSYTYAVLTNILLALTEGVGLDPYIGCLHDPDTSRRPTLALDLLEPFRPVLADRLTSRLVNLGTLKPHHFETKPLQSGTFINYEGRLAILKEFSNWSISCDDCLGKNMPSPSKLLNNEVDRYAAAAKAKELHTFIPYYLAPKDKEKCPDLDL